MSNYTHETVPTKFVEADGIRYAYRRFGKPGTIPLLFLEYFNSNMDGWDPDVTNSLAADHEVILFDNAGVGASGGKTPHMVAEMTKPCVAFCRALGWKQIHVVGFSLGGMIAQQLALEHPQLVGRLILLGTGPRGGEDMTFTELSPEEQADPVAFLLAAFFSPSEASQAAGREYMKRLKSRKNDRDLPVSRDSAVAQLAAIREWGTIPATGRYATLKSITHPTLIVHGNKDIVVTPINAFILAEHLPNAQLIMYPDSSHGAFYQHRKAFLEQVKLFLSDGDSMVAEEIVSIHTDIFNRALKEQDYAALEGLYADDYMLVRPDGSVLNKQEVLQDLRSGGLRFHSIELGQTEVRVYGSTAVLTAESQAVSSRDEMESRSHFRLIAVYVQQGQSIKLVHFQSTVLR